jgi:hypothetical protein
VPGVEVTQRLAGTNELTGPDGGGHRLVRGPQPAGVVDADHTAAGHDPRERDHARSGRADGLARGPAEVDAAVSRQPRPRRRRERPQHDRDRGQRPHPPHRCHPTGLRRSGRGRRRDGRGRRQNGRGRAAEEEDGDDAERGR